MNSSLHLDGAQGAIDKQDYYNVRQTEGQPGTVLNCYTAVSIDYRPLDP